MQRNAMQGRAEQRNATRWSFQPSADYGRLLGGYWYSPNAQHRIAVNRIAKHRNAKHGTAAQCIAKQGIATRYQLIASVGFVESLSGCLLRHQMQCRAAHSNALQSNAWQSRASQSTAERSNAKQRTATHSKAPVSGSLEKTAFNHKRIDHV